MANLTTRGGREAQGMELYKGEDELMHNPDKILDPEIDTTPNIEVIKESNTLAIHGVYHNGVYFVQAEGQNHIGNTNFGFKVEDF